MCPMSWNAGKWKICNRYSACSNIFARNLPGGLPKDMPRWLRARLPLERPTCWPRGVISRWKFVIRPTNSRRMPGMRIRKVTLRELHMQLLTPFQISVGTTDVRRILVVEVDVDGVVGWGECVAGETPMYSPETTETAWHILRDHLWPIIKSREFDSATSVWELLGLVRGHEMAKGALEAAVWDAEAKQRNVPLWKLLGGTREEIASG